MSNGIVSSVTRGGTFEPFDLQIARSQILGHTNVNINGFQTSVTSQVPLWENNSVYTFPSSAVAMTVASASGSTDAGIQVLVSGLDASWNILTETATLNASGTYTTTGLFLRINSLIVTSGKPAGNITAKNSSTTYAQITAGNGRSQMTIYSIPNGYTFYLRRINCWVGSAAPGTNYVLYDLTYTNNALSGAPVFQAAQIGFWQFIDVHRLVPNVFTQKNDLQFLFTSSDSGTAQHVAMYAEGLLIQNDVLTTQPGQ